MDDRTVTVELSVSEARALVRTAELVSSALVDIPWEGGGVYPLDSGAMKLALSLVLVGAEA